MPIGGLLVLTDATRINPHLVSYDHHNACFGYILYSAGESRERCDFHRKNHNGDHHHAGADHRILRTD